ncbi:hypothetical protein D9M68_988980 [compost metagenome]
MRQGKRGHGHLLGEFRNTLAFVGEGIGAGTSVNQLELERSFERGDAPGHGGVVDTQGLGSGRQRAGRAEGGEMAQVFPIEHE